MLDSDAQTTLTDLRGTGMTPTRSMSWMAPRRYFGTVPA